MSHTPGQPTLDAVLPEIEAFVARCQTLGLATVDDSGAPHAANIWYASAFGGDNGRRMSLLFVSSPESAHSRHVTRDPRVAVTIYAHVEAVGDIHGLQMHGLCDVLAPGRDDAEQAWQVFAARYPFVTQSELMAERFRRERFYRVTPTWLRWIDNRRGFGWSVEGDL